MANTVIELSGVRLFGKKYDLNSLINATECVVDSLIRGFGRGLARVSVYGQRAEVHAWPEPGKYFAYRKWQEFSRAYDACDDALVYSLGPVSVVAYLLGTETFALDPAVWTIRSSSGRYGGGIDPVPGLCVFGANLGSGRFDLLEPWRAQQIDRLFGEQLSPLSLDHGIREHSSGPGRIVVATFRHDPAFGRGEQSLRVRCLADLQTLKPQGRT